MMTRGDLSNEQWARLEPLLPSSKGKRGHPYKDHRLVINGIRGRAKKGGPDARSGSARSKPGRVLDEAASRLRRAGPAAGNPCEPGATAREYPTGTHPGQHPGAATAGAAAETAGRSDPGQRVQLSALPARAAGAEAAPCDPGAQRPAAAAAGERVSW